MTRRHTCWPLALFALSLGSLPVGAAGRSTGLIVEAVGEGFAAHRAGLRPGDILHAWERVASPPASPQPASGALRSPFDLEEVQIEQAPRGELAVLGTRGGETLRAVVPEGTWRLETRPPFGGVDLQTYEEAKALVDTGDMARGLPLWMEMASALAEAGDHTEASWLYFRVATTADRSRSWEIAERAFGEALEIATASGDPSARATIADALGRSFQGRSELDRASVAFQEALEIRRAQSPTSLAVAKSLHNLGTLAWYRGDLDAAEDHYRRSLAIREELAPRGDDVARSLNNLGLVASNRGDLARAEYYHRRSLAIKERIAPQSLDVAGSLNNLGIVASNRGDLDAAEEYYRRSLAIHEELAPQGLDVATNLNNLGLVAWRRGDLAMAEDRYRRSLAIQEKLAPHSLAVATSLNNLGIVARLRGDLATAEDHYRRSLAIQEKLAPQSLDVARSFNNLGGVASDRGDLATAESCYRRSLAIQEKLAPQSLAVAASLDNLGIVAFDRGDPAAAEGYHRRSLAINEKLAPRSLDVAASLNNLGLVALDRKDLATAEARLRRALAIFEDQAPRSLDAAESLHRLADVALARGDLDSAEAHHRRALAIRRELAPGSAREAASCQRLAALHRRRHRDDLALGFYACAVDALESQQGRLGGSDEARAGFRAVHAGYYREAIDLLVEKGEAQEAFHLLERYRARGLLALLAERDLVFRSGLPPELERVRRVTNAEYDRAFGQLSALSDNSGPEEKEEARRQLHAVRLRQDEVRSKIRLASPRLAALQYPEPLDLGGVRRTLDPGTLLLSYSVGAEQSHLFAVGPGEGEFEVQTLPVGARELRDEVFVLRTWIDRRSLRPQLEEARARLSATLLAPVAGKIARAERLMILPDGPLHHLPFAALADPGAGTQRYLVEARPLFVAASATVFAELVKDRPARPAGSRARGRRSGEPVDLVAFGDPVYSDAEGASGERSPARSFLGRGSRLEALPGTRREVEALRTLFPDSSRIYLGADATEERAKSLDHSTSMLHFACHGILDERFPLESALALSIPRPKGGSRENGLLQAWEVFEEVRIDADLVTLSACSSGLGKELAGEGLLGLTRAFQHAGARTVLTSLWAVSDGRTAELMKRFYRGLQRGLSKDEALRRAQMDLIRAPIEVVEAGQTRTLDSSHPFYWAAFELVGDWR